MKKQILAIGLSCLMTASMAMPAAAARVNTADTTPVCLTDYQNWQVVSVDGGISFDQLENKIKYNNLTVKSFDQTLESMNDMNWNSAINDLEDAIEDMEDLKAQFTAPSNAVAEATALLDAALNQSGGQTIDSTMLGTAIKALSAATAASTFGTLQAESLGASIESMEDQLEDLKEQKKDYYEKNIPDAERQFASITNQIISGAESLYMAILSLEMQKDALESSLTATNRMMEELELRYELGQIPQITLAQVETGIESIKVGLSTMETSLVSLKASLQSMVGDPVTGQMKLAALPVITAGKISTANQTKDLETAKENSYDLYTAARTVEDAEDEMNDARKEHGKKSYQYEMAEHSYEAALLQQEAALQDFELGFLALYHSLSPALATFTAAESTLAYEERVYSVEELKYSLGNISANDLADARDALDTARRDHQSAQLDLFTAWYNYQLAVERGIITSASAAG